MSQVTVLKADNDSSIQSLNNITNAIRNRANQLAQSGSGTGTGSGSGSGSSSDATRNWLQAERDLFCVPEATLSESDQQFSIQVAAAGNTSNNLEVIATSNSLTVRSTSGNGMSSTSGSQGNIVFSDVDSRMLYRRFDLPSSIDTGQVTASLDNGMINISAQKASASTRRSSAAKA